MSNSPHELGSPRAETCPQCQEQIISVDEREFERLWENHKAAHRAEDIAADQPTEAALVVATEKAKADAAQLERLWRGEKDHQNDLERHFEGVSRIEKRLPKLIDFCFKMADQVDAWCQRMDYRPKALKVGTIYWTPSGEIAAEFDYDKFDLSAPVPPAHLKRGYVRLPMLQKNNPAVFELCMTMGHHLINIIDMGRAKPKDLTFTNLHYFRNPNTLADCWSFKIVNRRQVLKQAKAHI